MKKQELINHLESLSNTELPDKFYKYKADDLRDLVHYANEVVAFQNAGLDKLFESMSLTMKYIPNFALVSITRRFLEPPLAARITQKLTMKQIVSVGNSLPADYLAEVSLYQDARLGADILAGLKASHAADILQLMCENHPYKILEIYQWLTSRHQKQVKEQLDLNEIDESDLHADRLEAFRELSR